MEDNKILIKLSETTGINIIAAIISYILGVFIVPMVIAFSKKEGLVDMPGERKIHKIPVSRIGGVAIWSSTMLTFLLLVLLSCYPFKSLVSGLLLGGSLMFLLGLIDDIYNLNAKFKLLLQILIVTVVYFLGVRFDTIFNPLNPTGDFIHLNMWFSYPLTILWIVGISNAVNFIDGVDGLAGSVITINAITLAIIALAMTPPNPISALIAFILAGSMMAFLTFNFNPAKIFMGDSGALFSGFMLASISITGVMKSATLAILLPFIVLAVPIMDITYSSLRRIFKGKSPFVADAEHIHHKLLKAGFSQKLTVVIMTAIAVIAGSVAMSFMSSLTIKHYVCYILSVIILMLVLSLFDIFTKNNK
ncbi:MAG: undecaprenyl/decaprenyl-phosphate alpha-N-acetylglucosaminyl 1-phosphate transferase [Candidatus Gastranaerophilales bacterium]|nr:undecaprenyl/decaprenyl-phosphate alpha-N-acetylglucosaminyl 1-phosphate transferase [Candidatus Gastranaerophilales bacterium]